MKNYFTLLALAFVTLASCDKENPIPEPLQGEQANISVAMPVDIGTLQQLTWATESDTKTNFLPLDLTGCTLSNGTLTAYLAFAPTEMNIKKGGKLTVTLAGSQKVCKAVVTIADGISYTAGKQYTTTVDGTNTPWQVLTPKVFSLTEDKATRFNGKTMNFNSCFQNVGSALTDVSKSIAPDLWNYTTEGATWTTKDYYKGCKASNTAASDIPVAWGGSK